MEEIIKILDECDSITQIAIRIEGYSNGKVNKKVKEYIIKYNYEHKFLESSEEKYKKTPKKCKECLNSIEYKKRYNLFCSSNCSASYNNKLRGEHSNETKSKISLALKGVNKGGDKILKEYIKKCIYCNNDFLVKRVKNEVLSRQKTCSDECQHFLKSDNSKKIMRNLIETGKHKGWQSRNIESYSETFFKKVLENNNIKYEFNKIISKRSLGLDCDANYFLDFFIVDKNVDLEIDGKQHKIKERIDSDKLRDDFLIKNGFVVYRIKWKNINSKKGKEYIKNEIDKFLNFIK
jgi:very-short-patch-repair endonuclease